jgi:protein phosphatase 2C family protein 2/3
MEDASTILYPFNNSSSSLFLGVFDGHAGNLCSNYLSNTLPGELQKLTRLQNNNNHHHQHTNSVKPNLPKPEFIQDVFLTTDQQWLQVAKSKAIEDGSTALCLVMDGPDLMVANCGDSRAILHQSGETMVLTRDHVPDDQEEHVRIKKLGGTVIGGRLQGKLAVSRAFGNYEFKESKYLISEPEIQEVTVQSDAEFLVVGCDGLYEQFSNDEIISFIKNRIISNPLEVAVKDLVEEALDRGTSDNLTVIVVKFTKAYKKLVRKSLKVLSKSSKTLPISKGRTLPFSSELPTGISLKTSSKITKPHSQISLSEPIVKIKKDNPLRTAGKHPIGNHSCPIDPGAFYPIIQIDKKLEKKFSKASSKSPSPPKSAREYRLSDLPSEKTTTPKSSYTTGLKSSLLGRALTKSS